MELKLELIERKVHNHPGYGAGSGEVIGEKYKCPCGKGIVYYEKDDIPGFRERYIYCDCKDCDEKYEFGRGIAIKK